MIEAQEQRSLEWFRARFGHITGSKVGDLMKSGRKKDDVFGETAKSYIYQVAAERDFRPEVVASDDSFEEYIEVSNVTTRAMAWGVEQEGEARECYEQVTELSVETVGSCLHDTIPLFAASPDGIVTLSDGTKRCIEIKCPNISTFMRYKTEIIDANTLKAVKPEYYWQTVAEMSCTGAQACDFIIYCRWLKEPIHIVTMERDEEAIKVLEERVKLANDFIDNIINH